MDIHEKMERITGEPQPKNEDPERSLAMEMLQELKESGKRWQHAFFAVLILLALTIGGFIIYLAQYDYTSTTSYEAAGVYAVIDSQGNVISQDFTQEDWDKFTEWWKIYGESKDNQNQNTN